MHIRSPKIDKKEVEDLIKRNNEKVDNLHRSTQALITAYNAGVSKKIVENKLLAKFDWLLEFRNKTTFSLKCKLKNVESIIDEYYGVDYHWHFPLTEKVTIDVCDNEVYLSADKKEDLSSFMKEQGINYTSSAKEEIKILEERIKRLKEFDEKMTK